MGYGGRGGGPIPWGGGGGGGGGGNTGHGTIYAQEKDAGVAKLTQCGLHYQLARRESGLKAVGSFEHFV